MRISEGVEWALHCCGVLSALPSDKALPVARLAEYHGVPAAYLAKHMQALSRAGIVETVRGPRGGYRLARPPAFITVLEIVEAVDGDDPAFTCTEIRRRGPCAVKDPKLYAAPCGITAVMRDAETAWRSSLAEHTVADLAMHALYEAPRRQLADTAVWIQEVAR
ncbi:MAG TPA: Rrf2 family transcriptional regulator [Acidimicrobiia bacterium]|nr:Rrf2 family transcriptional regulator [Acidimicrobiia bacterium]